MKNTEIKYNLSTDYERLYELLHKGLLIIGFAGVSIYKEVTSLEYSKLIEMKYVIKDKKYDFYTTVFFNDMIKSKEIFAEICKKENIRFFDLEI